VDSEFVPKLSAKRFDQRRGPGAGFSAGGGRIDDTGNHDGGIIAGPPSTIVSSMAGMCQELVKQLMNFFLDDLFAGNCTFLMDVRYPLDNGLRPDSIAPCVQAVPSVRRAPAKSLASIQWPAVHVRRRFP